MNVSMDLLLTENGVVVTSPQFPAWRYRPTDPDAEDETIHAGAEQSLRRHLGKLLTFSWNGWGG